MYNRYVPRNGHYIRIPEEDGPVKREVYRERPSSPPEIQTSDSTYEPVTQSNDPPRERREAVHEKPGSLFNAFSGKSRSSGHGPPLSSLFKKGKGGIVDLIKGVGLKSFDFDDILLALILLFLLIDGEEDDEIIIVLALILIMGL